MTDIKMMAQVAMSTLSSITYEEEKPLFKEEVRLALTKVFEGILEDPAIEPERHRIVQSGLIPFFNGKTPDESMSHFPVIVSEACNIARRELGSLFNTGVKAHDNFKQVYGDLDDSFKGLIKDLFIAYSTRIFEITDDFLSEYTAEVTELVDGWNSACTDDTWRIRRASS